MPQRSDIEWDALLLKNEELETECNAISEIVDRQYAEVRRLRAIIEDDGLECLPACDSYGHAELCPYASPGDAYRALRARAECAEANHDTVLGEVGRLRAEQRDERLVAKLQAASMKDAMADAGRLRGVYDDALKRLDVAEAEDERLRARITYYEEAVCLTGNPLALPVDGTETEAVQVERVAAVLDERERLRAENERLRANIRSSENAPGF